MEIFIGDLDDAIAEIESESGNDGENDPSEVFHLNADVHQVPPQSSFGVKHKRLIVDDRVTRIPFHAFQSWSGLESVKIFSPALDVGMAAFAQCSLISIDLSSCNILRLGNSVFENCGNLEQVTFSESCSLVELQKSAFKGCSSLKNIRLPETVKTIMESCFENCYGLTHVQLPDGLVGLRANVFRSCTSLESIDIPGSTKHIGMHAFSECYVLKSVKLHEGLESIADSAFGRCSDLESIQLPTSVVTLGINCFASCCWMLRKVELPPLLKRIDDGVFTNCCLLKRVWVPPSVEYIGYHAFGSCTNLVSLEIPQHCNLSYVSGLALTGCFNLRNMALPTTAALNPAPFFDCRLMRRRADILGEIDMLEALQSRFEGLPVHDMCYRKGKDLDVSELEDALAADSECTFLRRDRLGMNLLQILLLSFNPKREILLFYVNKYPTSLIPTSFDIYPTIDTDVQSAIDDLFQLDESSTIQEILEVSLSHRLEMLGLKQWKDDIYNQIASFSSGAQDFESRLDVMFRIFSNLEGYDRLETTSLLELAIWKATLDADSVGNYHKNYIMGDREQSRLTNGSNVIIPQVAAFLWDVDVD